MKQELWIYVLTALIAGALGLCDGIEYPDTLPLALDLVQLVILGHLWSKSRREHNAP